MIFGFFGLLQDLVVMIFSVDEQKNKVFVYVGVFDFVVKQGLKVLDWLWGSLVFVNGKGGGGKNGFVQGQVMFFWFFWILS